MIKLQKTAVTMQGRLHFSLSTLRMEIVPQWGIDSTGELAKCVCIIRVVHKKNKN